MTPLAVLLGTIVLGLTLGRVKLLGLTFGTSAILFVALLAGHFGLEVPAGFGTLGLALFVYCVGISAGPTFFRGLASQGRTMAALGVLIVLCGVAVTRCCAKLFHLPADLAGGLMAGALTSTPALGAISEASSDPASVAVGFGVAYPIGIISVVLFVQLAMKWLLPPIDPYSEQATSDEVDASTTGKIVRRGVDVLNPGIIGKRPSQISILADSRCQLSRIQLDKRWRPTPADYVFQLNDKVLLVGELPDVTLVAETLGLIQEQEDDAVMDVERERKNVVVTSPKIYGQTLKDLRLRSLFGVTVVRIRRHDIEFVPSARTRIEFGDTLTMVGEPSKLSQMERVVGHRPRTLNETDLLSLLIGVCVGILVGNFEIDIAGLSVSLGVAGGPLMVGLVMGHFRRLGPIRGSFPPAAQLLMTEGGLAFFLADAGVHAGANVGQVFAEHGLVLILAAALIVVVPMLLGYWLAKHLFRLSLFQSLGATCGGLTSTPGLAVLTSATDSSQPVTSYVAAYPVALALITIVAPLLVELLKRVG